MTSRSTPFWLPLPCACAVLAGLAVAPPARAEWIWVEGEKPTTSTMHRLKPDQLAAASRRVADANKGWFVFEPKTDPFSAVSGIDLRHLNEKMAGDGGWIGVKGSQFVHSRTGEPVRFWAVKQDTRRSAHGGAYVGQRRCEPRPRGQT
jgi:hypothetical protein